MIVSISFGDRRTAYRIDTATEVSWIVKDLASKNFQLQYGPEHYVLQYAENGEYLSDQNMSMYLRDGVEIYLKLSPAMEATLAVSNLRSNDDVNKKKTIFSLSKQFQDIEFAKEFIKKNGIDVLVESIVKSSGNTVAYGLEALKNLTAKESGWTNLSNDFIQKVVEFSMNTTLNICRPAVAILIQLAKAGPHSTGTIRNYGFQVIHDVLKSSNAYQKIVERIQNESDVETQMNSLGLINSLFKAARGYEQYYLIEKLDSLNTRKILGRLMQSTSSAEIPREITIFQNCYHNYLVWRKSVPIDRRNPEHEKLITEILSAAEITDGNIEKLGFKSRSIENELSPVGLLGLENIHYFSKKNRDFFSKYILEQNSRTDGKSCPFGVASVEITKLLVDHCQPQADERERESVILGFEDLYIYTLQAIFKLWSEMNAGANDMNKVVNLLRTHLEFIRREKDKDQTLDQYKSSLSSISYVEVQKKQLQVIEAGDDLLVKSTVRNLRERIYKEAIEFMKNQLINCLTNGSWFQNYSAKGRTKGYRFFKLAQNKKTFHWAEFPEQTPTPPLLEVLTEKIEISACKDIFVGQMCPLFSGKKGRMEDANLAFSIMPHEGENSLVDFVADNQTQYSEWTDGLRVLIGKTLNKNTANEATMAKVSGLAEIEIKLRMLNIRTENVNIPNEQPEIPPPPSNYAFCTK